MAVAGTLEMAGSTDVSAIFYPLYGNLYSFLVSGVHRLVAPVIEDHGPVVSGMEAVVDIGPA
jgi:hypothetical protein